MKVAITEADLRAALPEFLPVCTPRLVEEAIRAVRIAALRRQSVDACEAVDAACARVSASFNLPSDDWRAAYDAATAERDRATKRADEIWRALEAEREAAQP